VWEYDSTLEGVTSPTNGQLRLIIDADPYPVSPDEQDVTDIEWHHEAQDGVDNDAFWELVLADITASGHPVVLTRLDTGANITMEFTSKTHGSNTEKFACAILSGTFPPNGT